MKIYFTCGGTAGHINPAIAVANALKQRCQDCQIVFIGAKGHMEEKLVPQAGYQLITLSGAGLSRGKSLKAIKTNLVAVQQAMDAVAYCKKLFRKEKPDVVVGTGGYASFPALFAAQQLGIPTCVHEANALPGLTTKLVAYKADMVLVCFEESVKYYKNPDRVHVVGMPVRKEFITTTRQEARKALGLTEEYLVVSAFGSQGAKRMNETVADMLPLAKEDGYPFHLIHATGSFGKDWMPKRVLHNGVNYSQVKELDIREYIYDMPRVLSAADVVIGRAGSGTCNEIAACGIPCILIPSPNVTNNHQEKNAKVLSDRGGAVLLLEQDCTPRVLYRQIMDLLQDSSRRQKMAKALQQGTILDSAERMCESVLTLCNGH